MAPDRDAFDPSQRAFVETFQAGFLAFGAGGLGAVALDVSTTTCIAGGCQHLFAMTGFEIGPCG